MGIETLPTAGATALDDPPSQLQTLKEAPTKDSQAPKKQVGVADYFAIVGVGEDLVWKHSGSSSAEDEDAKWMERFYREIVDCNLIVTDQPSYPTTLVFSKSPRSQADHAYPPPSLTSPVPSDVTSGVGTDVPAMEFEGWTVVQQTQPATGPEGSTTIEETPFWQKGQTWEANLDPIHGLTGEIRQLEADYQRQHASRKSSTPLKDLRERVQLTFQQRQIMPPRAKAKYFLSYRRRAPDESRRPAIADIALHYVRLHKATIDDPSNPFGDSMSVKTVSTALAGSTVSQKGAAALIRVAEVGKQTFQSRVLGTPQRPPISASSSIDCGPPVPLESLLTLPEGLEEWAIPQKYQELRFPSHPPPDMSTPYKTVLFPPDDHGSVTSGVEAVQKDTPPPKDPAVDPAVIQKNWQDRLRPQLLTDKSRTVEDNDEYIYVPILAIRRQRVGEEERFCEDPALVEMTISFCDSQGNPVLPYEEEDPFEDETKNAAMKLLDPSDWTLAAQPHSPSWYPGQPQSPSASGPNMPDFMPSRAGSSCILIQRNIPLGFCDAAFSTSVLDRFPYKNYKGLPLPEEELPMFCYPTGCRLHRAKFCDAPLPQYYGFVVKNERGDSICVSCVSFMEPLTRQKREQLAQLSSKRRRVSLPHARYWDRRQQRYRRQPSESEQTESSAIGYTANEFDSPMPETNMTLTSFDDMTTFENKTICLVSRYPYWTAFRRFLSHLHNVSGSSSDLPLERYISHLLLAVPIPPPGGPSVLLPLPTFSEPMMLWSPHQKDLPLLDLPYERLVSCLDVPTVVTVVLGFLALERKVIVMSTRPSLVLDVCELLRSLLFPFDLCAPYVPRLTEPFMSCLDFPGAIFVGIHDDGTPDGLAAGVRKNLPEDSTIVDLDSATVDCSGDNTTMLNTTWGVIPPGPRSVLISEIETLCRDAGIVPGQEPLDSLMDPAFEATMPSTPVDDETPLDNDRREPLDDRAIRDAFLRFFCSVLGGYERFLVVPDADYLVSGNEWFDAKGFLASAPEEKAPFLGSLVSTQLFQAFIQRRTEASDVHCLLFDECLAEYHAATIPYGRLGGDVETLHADSDHPQILYSLLVDQSAAGVNPSITVERSFDGDSRHGSDTDSSGHQLAKSLFSVSDGSDAALRHSEFATNATGDWVTLPSHEDLPSGVRFIYCIDGNPTFPDRLNPNSFLPRQPESWLVEVSTAPTPMLTRSGKEVEEADRRKKLATSYRGLQSQRRCLWQLPKLMGSHFLGAWLLCIPTFVAPPYLSHEKQSKYLLRAFGALRLLRSKQRIVPDEAAYRALIVACGRSQSDRRAELVRLFGLLRSDGIFPSAVTLGQYTKALAEGYSKQGSMGTTDDEPVGVEVTESASRDWRVGKAHKVHPDPETVLVGLDGNLANLEDSGRRWRLKNSADKEANATQEDPNVTQDQVVVGTERSKKKSSKPWLPVVYSSSFVSSRQEENRSSSIHAPLTKDNVRLLTMWSRTRACDSCGYVPLEEEVQAGWDVLADEHGVPGAINCPRCGSLLIPRLGYKDWSMDEALALQSSMEAGGSVPGTMATPGSEGADFSQLPPQIRPTVEDEGASDESTSYVTYISPAVMRLALERHIEEHGESILERDNLRAVDPEVFYNMWWYCARFSVPLPLPVVEPSKGAMPDATGNKPSPCHYFVFCSWEHRMAKRGCYSCARVLKPLLESPSEDDAAALEASSTENSLDTLGDYPILSRFNLQGYYSTVWDHEDMSEILVTLVEACDRRDFRPVVECLLRCNKRRREKYGKAMSTASGSDLACSSLGLLAAIRTDGDSTPQASMELDCYRTALYLAKYQCTSAFHAFFPATLKPCKGYHFWCPVGPVPIFDRLLREAVKRVRAKDNSSYRHAPFQDVSDVALGFRCVFGHLL